VPWHNHKNEDELFFIVKGTLLIEIENQPNLLIKKEDLFVVKKGINHKVSSTEECLIMLMNLKLQNIQVK
jgi:quercetin dioxygenase-like cupin family protein